MKLPDSVAIRARRLSANLETWERQAYQPDGIVWTFFSPLNPDRKADTLRARLVSLNCGSGANESNSRPTLLLEHQGLYFGITTLHLVDPYLADQPTADDDPEVLVKGEGGILEAAVFRQDYPGLPDGIFPLSTAREQKKAANAERERADEAEVRAKRWPSRITKAVLAGEVSVGMTAEMVRLSWGDPDDINRTVTADGSSEQWVYELRDSYVYLENGVVTAYQD